jgi:7,8-dihydroneopterin aldolase/epimerase/oxygenase
VTIDTAFQSGLRLADAPREAQGLAAPDVIFVRDLVLPCRIGIHDDEQDGHQRIRFSVEIAVEAGAVRDRRGPVVCYDAIIAAIQGVIDAGHIKLVETLAERVAAACLALDGAQQVQVQVEKLDRVPGAALGVAITRTRAPDEPDNVVPLNPAAGD